MSYVKTAAALGLALCTGCSSGPVLENRDLSSIDDRNFDGGYISYFLPKGIVTVTAEFNKDKVLTLAIGKPEIVPDFKQHFHLIYNHAGLGTDSIKIETDNGLLASVSSNPVDQTIDLVKGVASVLQQFQVTQAAIEKAAVKSAPKMELAPGKARPEDTVTCGSPLKTVTTVDMTNGGREVGPAELIWGDDCELHLEIVGKALVDRLDARMYPRPGESRGEVLGLDACNRVVCFRLAGAYTLTATASIVSRKTHKPYVVGEKKFEITAKSEFLAPMRQSVGYIRFDRRSFATHKTTATFKSGMLTAIEATDSSQLVGFLSLPLELLKAVTILVTI